MVTGQAGEDRGMSQSRKLSAAEAVANVAIGYVVAIIAQILIFPLFGIFIPVSEHLAIGVLFTFVSLGRSYALRRLFNRVA
jgi:hypothetical protein